MKSPAIRPQLRDQAGLEERRDPSSGPAPPTDQQPYIRNWNLDAESLLEPDWIWYGWLPRGKVTVMGTPSGSDFSGVVADIVSRVTLGIAFPCRTQPADSVNSQPGPWVAVVTAGADPRRDFGRLVASAAALWHIEKNASRPGEYNLISHKVCRKPPSVRFSVGENGITLEVPGWNDPRPLNFWPGQPDRAFVMPVFDRTQDHSHRESASWSEPHVEQERESQTVDNGLPQQPSELLPAVHKTEVDLRQSSEWKRASHQERKRLLRAARASPEADEVSSRDTGVG